MKPMIRAGYAAAIVAAAGLAVATVSVTAGNVSAQSSHPTEFVTSEGYHLRLVPDPSLTPGVGESSRTARDVPEEEKREVYAEYGITPEMVARIKADYHVKGSPFEIDHLVSLELDGTNDKKNLWPQPYFVPQYSAHDKDRLENKLAADIRAGTCGLAEAQYAISHDWQSAYDAYVLGKQ